MTRGPAPRLHDVDTACLVSSRRKIRPSGTGASNDGFDRERTRFFAGSFDTVTDGGDWGREGTRFSSRPRTTDDFDAGAGFLQAEETPAAVRVAPRESSPGQATDPEATPSPSERHCASAELAASVAADSGRTPAAAGPESADSESTEGFVERLRRGDFTDPSIRIDEFDEEADTEYVDAENLDLSWVPASGDPAVAERAREFLREVSARQQVPSERRTSESVDERLTRLLGESVPRPSEASVDDLLSAYLSEPD